MELRGLQPKIVANIEEIFWGIDPKKFVGIKIPTGGGKTYIFMYELLKFMEKYDQEKEEGEPKIEDSYISKVPIDYFAPQNPIIFQTASRVVENIILPKYVEIFDKQYKELKDKEEYFEQGFKKISKRIIKSSKRRGKNKDKLQQELKLLYENIKDADISPEDKLRIAIDFTKYVISDDIEKIIKSELPQLRFACYQKKQDIKNLNEEEPVLMVNDEGHKAVTPDWGKRIQERILEFKNTKVMSITATPERNDGIDAMAKMAKICGYTIREIREQSYLAANLTLAEALEKKLVVKPKIVYFNEMLDDTVEYKKMKQIVKSSKEKVDKNYQKYKEQLMRNGQYTNSTQRVLDRAYANIAMLYEACKVIGKNDFLIKLLQEENQKLLRVSQLSEEQSVRLIQNKELLKYMQESDNPSKFMSDDMMYLFFNRIEEMDEEGTYYNDRYKEWKEELVKAKIDDVIKENPYLIKEKGISFVPRPKNNSKKQEEIESKMIMDKYKELVSNYFGIDKDKILITHSNKQVIPQKEDNANLRKFIASKKDDNKLLMILAMDKFNEGIHADGVKLLAMFRQFDDSKENPEKKSPSTTFLQQVGRGVFAVKDGEEITEVPVILDFACNFMRYNNKLNNIFELPESQKKFKEISEKLFLVNENNKGMKRISQALNILEALARNDYDVSKITPQMKWKDVLNVVTDKEKKETILDDVFELTHVKIPNDYKFGEYLEAARVHFWHKERINEKTGKAKQLSFIRSDAIFQDYSIEKLIKIGFFEDIKQNRDYDKVDDRGFIIGECANFDANYGINIYTGNQYCKESDIEIQDVHGFKENGINSYTKTLYDRYFFRYDEEEGKWINLFTGEDKDLLGYNHEGIRIDAKEGKIGFDRNGLWHEKLEDGTYSKVGRQYDDKGYDVHDFNKRKLTPSGSDRNNHFLADGSNAYYQDQIYVDGYDIDGFNEYGFNRKGIHRVTGCYYSPQGYRKEDFEDKIKRPFPILESLKNPYGKNERRIVEWTILSNVYPQFKENNFLKIRASKIGIKSIEDINERVIEASPSLRYLQQLEFLTSCEKLKEIDIELNDNDRELKELTEERKKVREISTKLQSRLRKIEGDGYDR